MADKLTLDRQDMKNRATAHLRIYVGGLTEKATIDELYEHFIQFGQVNGIVINRNFGFVQFDTEKSAQDAIAKADGSVFQGKTLSVRTAQTTDKRRETEVVTIQSDVPPAVALSDNLPVVNEVVDVEELYDSYGNFIGDQREHEDEDGFPAAREGARGAGGRGRGLRGAGAGARGRGRGGRGGPAGFRERSPVGARGGDWSDRGYDRYPPQLPDYPRALPVTERNDCEIIVVSKALTNKRKGSTKTSTPKRRQVVESDEENSAIREYAEYIEGRLKRLGIVVDLLFPMEDVPIGKVLGNIASRGCLYAILVMPLNQEHRSLTLTILHGLPQEHRNMPLEDALQLLSRNFQEVQRGGSSGREAVYALLGQLADGRTLTALQYEKVIEYLKERREQQVKIELGEPLGTKKEVDLQQRILSILNEKKALAPAPPAPAPVPAPDKDKLLNDPTVRKALDSILQKLV